MTAGSACLAIAESTENDGIHPWVALRCVEGETGYRIRLTGLQSGESGESASSFDIPGPCALAVTAPAGGEIWYAETTQEIAWTQSGACDSTVRIDLLHDGSPCATLSEGTENDGLFSWPAAGCAEDAEGYKIRITEAAGGASTESQAAFSIRDCQLHLTSPNGGERWKEGSPQEIRWTYSECGETVALELLRDGALCRLLAGRDRERRVFPGQRRTATGWGRIPSG
jgi:hypothetical protein